MDIQCPYCRRLKLPKGQLCPSCIEHDKTHAIITRMAQEAGKKTLENDFSTIISDNDRFTIEEDIVILELVELALKTWNTFSPETKNTEKFYNRLIILCELKKKLS